MQANRSVLTIHSGGDGQREITQAHKAQAQSNIRKEQQQGEEDEALVGKAEQPKAELPLPYDESLMRLVESTDGFGEVMPQHKHQVVRILQHLGHVVGMTGDGVNDAPALKAANVGVAVSGATDAARGASDVILLSPGLSVIADAIVESRRIFSRMQAYATYRISTTVMELLFITLAALIWRFYLPPFALVLIAIWNDATVISVAFDRAVYKHIPVTWNMRVLISKATILGTFMAGSAFLFYYLATYYYNLDVEVVQTMSFLQVSTGSQVTIFSCRVESASFVSQRPSFYMLGVVLASQFLSALIAAYGWGIHAVGWMHVLQVWAYVFLTLMAYDNVKQMAHFLIVGDEEAVAHQKREEAVLAHPEKLAEERSNTMEAAQRSVLRQGPSDTPHPSLRRLNSGSLSRAASDGAPVALTELFQPHKTSLSPKPLTASKADDKAQPVERRIDSMEKGFGDEISGPRWHEDDKEM